MKSKILPIILVTTILVVTLINLTSAVTLDTGTILNTSESNTSMIFSIPIEVTTATVEAQNITLTGIVCSGEYTSTATTIFWDTPNAVSDSSEYCVTDSVSACNSMLLSFGTYPALIGLLGTIVLIGLAMALILGFAEFSDGINLIVTVGGIVTIIAVSVLVIVAIFMMQTLCATF